MQIGAVVVQVVIFAAVAVGIFLFFKSRNSKPKETEAKLVQRTERREGGTVTYTFVFETAKDGKKTFSTQEQHYAKLEEGRTGMLAYRRKIFVDFEMYDKHVR